MWVRAAIGPHLEELSLNISNCHGDEHQFLPPSLLMNCTNLVSLSLVGAIHITFQHSSVHFPSMKMLKLDSFNVELEEDIEEFPNNTSESMCFFLSGCPLLETLDIFICAGFLTKVPIRPSSKKLKFSDGNFSWTSFQIDSDWNGGSIPKTTLGIFGNLLNAREAYLDIFYLRESEFVDPLLNRLQDQGDLHLLLCHSTSKWPLSTRDLNYSEFCNLHHLKFILPCFNMDLVLNVLEKCNMLQVLIIQITKEEDEPSCLRTWEPHSTTVPKCLESHLTYIRMEGYQGFEDELEFSEYILRNGVVLHTMLIIFYTSIDLTNKFCSIKRLTDIPRSSVTCQLKFI